MKLYKTYLFKDKDPVIHQLRDIVDKTGEPWATVADRAGVSKTTLYNWFQGSTQRPQFATVMAVARACGADYRLVKVSGRRAQA